MYRKFRDIGPTGERVNSVLDRIRHGELCPVRPIEAHAGGEAVEKIATLCVVSRTEGQSTHSPGVHAVVVFFVGLDVLSIFHFAVDLVVDVFTDHDGTWADGG
jgi:hypothetical protein